jgi:hypothetical protein
LPNEVFRDAGLTDLDAQLQQLAMDPRSTHSGLSCDMGVDHGPDVRWDARSTERVTALLRPNEPEGATCQAMTVSGFTMTTADRQWSHTRASHTHKIRSAWVRADVSAARSLEDVKLVSQGEDLELQRRSRAQ